MPSADDQTPDAGATVARPAHAVNIAVPESFACYADAAATRLRYLFPSWEIDAVPEGIRVSKIGPGDKTLVQREVNYALYRERIRAEGEPLRELLLRSVMA